MTPGEFFKWCNAPDSKGKVVYWRGFLAKDLPGRPTLQAVTIAARNAYDAGLIELAQRRIDTFVFDYIAIRKSHPSRPAQMFSREATYASGAAHV